MAIADPAQPATLPPMPARPARALSTFRLLRVAQSNSLAACDEELFDELFVERRFLGRRLFIISDPDGVRRVMQDNVDNYPRLNWIRRVFEFGSGTGMLHAEIHETLGEAWLAEPATGTRDDVPAPDAIG